MWRKVFLIFTLLLMSYLIEAYKILVIFPLTAKSHGILGDGVVRHLLDAGHEVTYITPFANGKAYPKLRQIDISSNSDETLDKLMNIKTMIDKNFDSSVFFQVLINTNKNAITNINIQKLLNDNNEQFDLVIAEWMFTESLAGFAAVYDCPFIWFTTLEPHWIIQGLVDEYPNPAYSQDTQSIESAPLTFIERVKELFGQIMLIGLKGIYIDSLEKQTYEESFGPVLAARARSLPPYKQIITNASLIIANAHVSLGQSMRLPQNFKPVGGFHINSVPTPLSKDLKTVLDEAKHGVIYFSMGSNLKSKDIPDKIKKGILKMFGELKYNVIWKFEEPLPNLPSNVKIVQWAPQQSILAHPNCILFITHGGLLSSIETIHFGKPIIGIPVFGDQFNNVDRMVENGFAKRVDMSYTLHEELKAAITDILGDSRYLNKVNELSSIYHDRPVSPGQELVHWVKHVIQTRGALHLRSPALHVPFYQKCYLDLIVVILIVLVVTKMILNCFLKQIFRKRISGKQKQM